MQRFIIDIDSCELGVGAVLSQAYEGKEHPVAYFSQKFTKDESKWSSTELEAIGVLKALDHYRCYVYGVDFDVRCDSLNVTLAWLKNQEKGKLARWAMRLREYDGYMKILPRSGKKHNNADGLSRMGRHQSEIATSGDDCMGLGIPPKRLDPNLMAISLGDYWPDELWMTINSKLLDSISRVQRKDELCERVRRQVEGKALPDDPKVSGEFKVASGLIFTRRLMGRLRPPRWVVLVPKSYKFKILSLFHDGAFPAHLDVAKTKGLIANRFYWGGMDSDIKDYIGSCKWA